MPPGRTLAGHEAAPATGERQQHAGADEIKSRATFHTRENASSSFNEASTLAACDSVKDKKSLPTDPDSLEQSDAFGSHRASRRRPDHAQEITPKRTRPKRTRPKRMGFVAEVPQWKARPSSFSRSLLA